MVEPQYRIPIYDRPISTLGILIGNTKRLWPHFLDHLRPNSNWNMSPNPLDEYVRESVMKITLVAAPEHQLTVRFSDMAEKNVISFQKVAHLAGVYLNEIA